MWAQAVLLLTYASAHALVLPPDGTTQNRIHFQFEWEPVGAATDYQLVVVEDDRSADPFAGETPVVDVTVSAAEPRAVVTTGLAFGTEYAWRVRAIDGAPLAWGPTHWFATATLPPAFPTATVTPGPGTPEPGLTLVDIRDGGVGLAVLYELDGSPVWFLEWPQRIGDIRLLDTGRMLFLVPLADRGYETTLGGQLAWQSPDSVDLMLHHEIFPMPSGNYLSLAYELGDVMRNNELQTWVGSRIVELDPATNAVVWDWSSFDNYSTLDFDETTMQSPGVGGASFPDYYDWTHHNAVIYDPVDDAIYASARQLSRITRIDRATGNIVYNMGFDMPSGDVDFGDNLFSFEHAPEIQPNGNLLLYDNGNRRDHIVQTGATGVTKAVELAFTGTPPTGASIVWEWTQPSYAAALGDADRQPGGTTLVRGPNGTLYEVDASGVEVWRLELPPAIGMYRSERIPSLIVDAPGDSDSDGRADDIDNCPDHANPTQLDCNCDGFGDVCAVALGVETACTPGCAVKPPKSVSIFGTAGGGGIFVNVSGTFLGVPTSAGQSPEDVADAVVAAINADPVLSGAGISAASEQNRITLDGSLDFARSTDAGLQIGQPVAVPALSAWGLALVTGLLGGSALWATRRRPRA